MEVRRDRHATHLLHAHLVFVTKYRYKLFTGKHLEALKEIFSETMEGLGGELIEFDGESNHVHLLVQYPPKHSISLIVNTLKGRSSRLMRKMFPELKKRYWGKGALWHRSYFAGSVGGAPLEIVKRYIQNQATPE